MADTRKELFDKLYPINPFELVRKAADELAKVHRALEIKRVIDQAEGAKVNV